MDPPHIKSSAPGSPGATGLAGGGWVYAGRPIAFEHRKEVGASGWRRRASCRGGGRGEGPGASGLRSWGAPRNRHGELVAGSHAPPGITLGQRTYCFTPGSSRAATRCSSCCGAARPTGTTYAARGYRGRGLPRELKLCVAKPAGARAAWARAAHTILAKVLCDRLWAGRCTSLPSMPVRSREGTWRWSWGTGSDQGWGTGGEELPGAGAGKPGLCGNRAGAGNLPWGPRVRRLGGSGARAGDQV